jgi:hypothetical protein
MIQETRNRNPEVAIKIDLNKLHTGTSNQGVRGKKTKTKTKPF